MDFKLQTWQLFEILTNFVKNLFQMIVKKIVLIYFYKFYTNVKTI